MIELTHDESIRLVKDLMVGVVCIAEPQQPRRPALLAILDPFLLTDPCTADAAQMAIEASMQVSFAFSTITQTGEQAESIPWEEIGKNAERLLLARAEEVGAQEWDSCLGDAFQAITRAWRSWRTENTDHDAVWCYGPRTDLKFILGRPTRTSPSAMTIIDNLMSALTDMWLSLGCKSWDRKVYDRPTEPVTGIHPGGKK